MLNSFKYAFQGIKDSFKSEPNLRFHFLAAFLVIVIAKFLNFSLLELSILVLTIGFVIALELVNTLVEKIVDLVHPEISEKARIIKDISAASVLIAAITATIIAILLFIPKLNLLW